MAAPTFAEDLPDALARIAKTAKASRDSYAKLIALCDDIGHRLSGSPALDRAGTWAQAALINDGIATAHREPVTVPHWVRGNESLLLESPRPLPLPMLGLGGSGATPAEGISAQVLVVKNQAELKAKAAEAKGKIILFNQVMPPFDPKKGSGYGDAVQQRALGAQWAHEVGAVAALVRSVTARSLSTPHTGAARSEGKPTPVPTAAITTEHADLLARFQERGQTIAVRLKMDAHFEAPVTQHNVVAELRGRELPEEIVLIGAHLDSWDVGQGAHDDGAGVVMAMQALATLKQLGLQPKRTIRAVLFVNEENGLAGGKAYFEAHKGDKHVAALEADSGAFAPSGLGVDAKTPKEVDALAAWAEKFLVPLRAQFGALTVDKGHGGADISPLTAAGVPSFGLAVEGSRYFDYHHTAADTVDKVDPAELAACSAYMAALAYALAETNAAP